jgi:transcription termination/antitermination protein NusG
MDYRNWYALSINMNKERSCKEQLLARKAKFIDPNLLNVDYLQRKELVIEKSGKRRVKNKLLMSGYLLVQVKPEMIEDVNGNISKSFPADTFNLILGTPGIKFFVNMNKDKPIAMPAKEIKKMFDLCDEAFLEVKQNIMVDYQEGDTLEVIAGPFKGYSCEVQAVQGDKILGHIDMFGRTVPAEFTTEQVYKSV